MRAVLTPNTASGNFYRPVDAGGVDRFQATEDPQRGVLVEGAVTVLRPCVFNIASWLKRMKETKCL